MMVGVNTRLEDLATVICMMVMVIMIMKMAVIVMVVMVMKMLRMKRQVMAQTREQRDRLLRTAAEDLRLNFSPLFPFSRTFSWTLFYFNIFFSDDLHPTFSSSSVFLFLF